ncbi:SGNH/GDSL hydrolase family protein [Rhizobium halophytocola]|uniref:Lysophospholipase L1-like esterase n=1 Tax=Rhizobium halophytocola TaxID=735519 RepID=A0ABS4E436_9HYPH|nr:GDSL-type esterase/lipase family protein [Rhizobium halophytocola]MBP1852677.1 lysophospholipase L1-like esterase [Rhizobium halophytocola]
MKTTGAAVVSSVDYVLGNKGGSTAQTSIKDLSIQVAGSEAVQSQNISLRAETWASLNSIIGTRTGQPAEVPSQSGTHTDPVAGGTVSNQGLYRWNGSPAGWRWVGPSTYTAFSDRVATIEDKSVPLWGHMTNITAAATTDLATIATDALSVVGGTTISSFGVSPDGAEKVVRFNQTLTLTYNATSMILPGGANIVVAAGDIGIFRSIGSGNWRCISFLRNSGKALAAPARSEITELATVWTYGSNIASAATMDLAAAEFFNVTGTAVIVSLGPAPLGTRRTLYFASLGLTLTHNVTSLVLPGGADIITSTGDIAEFVCVNAAGNWRCVSYQRSSGKPVVLPNSADVGLGNVSNTADADKPVSTPQAAAIATASAGVAAEISIASGQALVPIEAIIGILTRAGITISDTDKAALLSPPPALALDFANGASLSIVRPDAGLLMGRNRRLKSGVIGIGRSTYDPLSGELIGLLLENNRGNIWSFSDDVSAGQWSKGNCSVEQGTVEVIDPAGGQEAAKWIENTVTGNHQIFRAAPAFPALSADMTAVEWRIYKAGTRSKVLMTASGKQAQFDLITGEVQGIYTTTPAYTRHLRDGWVLCAMAFPVAAGATSYTIYERIVTTGQITNYAGDGVSHLYRYHANGGLRSYVQQPVKTNAAAAVLSDDQAVIDVGGWFRRNAASLVVSSRAPLGEDCTVVQLDDGTEANRIRLYRAADKTCHLEVTAAGVQIVNVSLGTWADDTDRSVALSMRDGNVAYSVNGKAVAASALSAFPPGIGTLRLGRSSASGLGAVVIRNIEGHARGLSDGELAARATRRPDARIAAYGDSITAGNATGVTDGYDYPAILQRLLQRTVFNGGIGGETSAQIKTRLLADVDRKNWLFVIGAGRNDGNAQTTILANIATMVADLPYGGRYLILSVPYAADTSQAEIDYVGAINGALASAYADRFIPIDWSMISRVSDNLHPDDGGNAAIAAAVASKINSKGW